MSTVLTVCMVVEQTVYLPGSFPISQSFFKRLTWETETPPPGHMIYITSIFVVLSNLFEFVFYTIIIWELFKNQLTLNAICISSTTNPTMSRRRVRKNSITALGHFISWLIESITLLFFIQGIVAQRREDQYSISLASWTLLMLVPSVNYSILPMVQTLTSPELRSHMFSSVSCECNVRPCGDEAAMQVEEGIELAVIYNPNAQALAQG